MTITLTHLVEVVTDGFGHRALCSCGWRGDWSDDEAAAVAGVEHRDGEVGPPDEVDRCISGLLDLQDDIAEAVIWLAQNWSADLPAPGWYAGSAQWDDGPVVTVILPCLDLDELARAADILGVEPVDDDTPDRHGGRYRCATRCFGRVAVLALVPIEGGGS